MLALELWWRGSALSALAAFTRGLLPAAPPAEQPLLARQVAALLRPTLDVVAAQRALQDPARAKGGPAGVFAGAAATLQLRLLQCYLALPGGAAAFPQEQEALSKLCMRAVRAAATAGSWQVAASAARRWLDPEDALLGPWQAGRDPLEGALVSFEGVPGGPPLAAWEAGSRQGVGYALTPGEAGGGAPVASAPGGGEEEGRRCFPQPRALGALLLEAQLGVLGSVLEVTSTLNQVAILEALLATVDGGPQVSSLCHRVCLYFWVRGRYRHVHVMLSCASAAACRSGRTRTRRGARPRLPRWPRPRSRGWPPSPAPPTGGACRSWPIA